MIVVVVLNLDNINTHILNKKQAPRTSTHIRAFTTVFGVELPSKHLRVNSWYENYSGEQRGNFCCEAHAATMTSLVYGAET